MDNKIISQIKRGLKVTTNYLLALIVFGVFFMPIITMFEANMEGAIFYYSVLIFLLLFYIIYSDMNRTAFKEKRPQYNINPPPYKGFIYGLIGVIPLVIVEIILMSLKVPADFLPLQRRLYQGFAGPLYWLAKLLGNEPVYYIVSFTALILIAGLGYFTGFKEFYLTAYIRKQLEITSKKSPVKKK